MKQWILLLLLALPVAAHTVEHKVERHQAVVVTVFLGEELASYSEYEVLAPGGEEPFQIGRTDAQGRVCFIPDKAGNWKVKVSADSQHGLHGVSVDVEVKPDMTVEDSSAPPIATHTRLLVGISLLFGVFGLVALLRNARSKA